MPDERADGSSMDQFLPKTPSKSPFWRELLSPVSPPFDASANFRGFNRAASAGDGDDEDDRAAAARLRDLGAAPTVGRMEAGDGEFDVAPPRARKMVLPLPSGKSKPSLFSRVWFVLGLVAPILLGSVYYLFIASNQYVCEFRFSVREPISHPMTTNTDNPAGTFQGAQAMGGDQLDNFTVTDYVASAQAARDLEARLDIAHMYDARGIDPLARFNPHRSAEGLARYWKHMVYSNYDPASGLAVVRVRAFTPEDSYKIATTLVALSDTLVNRIGQTSQQDSLRFAELEVARSQQQVATLRRQLAGLRDTDKVIDPTTTDSTDAGNAALATTLRSNIAMLQTQIGVLKAQLHNSTAPQIVALQQRLTATQAQLASVTAEVTASARGRPSLASATGSFEDIKTRLQDETQILLMNRTNLQQAQSSADAQRVYLTDYVQPAVPQGSIYPNRLGGIGLVAIISLMIWLIGLLLFNSVVEHVA